MDISALMISDPKTGEKSVSLSLLMITFFLIVLAGGLEIAGVIKSTGVFLELFMTNAGLYFGRRLTFANGKASSLEKE